MSVWLHESMTDEIEDHEQGADPNEGGASTTEQLTELDAMIAADEAADASRRESAQRLVQQRGDDGRFKNATEGRRDGQRQTPTEINGAAARAKPEGDPTGKPKADVTPTGDTTTQQPKDTSPQPSPKSGEAEDKGKSRYEKAKEREAITWTQINKTKEEQTARAADLDLREKTLAAREQALQTGRTAAAEPMWQGYSAGQLEQAATNYDAKGQFQEADEARRIARGLTEQKARQAQQNSAGGLEASWQQLRTDLPEMFDPRNPLNQQMRETLTGDPKLLGDAAGPYRAALKVGRQAIARLEADSAKYKAEADKLPGLQQRVSELTAKVQELERLTSLGDGGGQNRGVGSRSGKTFAQMSTAEMEQSLENEFAQALG